MAAPYRGHFEWRILATFGLFAVAWLGVIVLGVRGSIPLWLGFIANVIFASTFYMPLHEAAHGNLWGRTRRGRWAETLVGMLCAIPLASTSFASHQTLHMRHHAYTNDPGRDPDHFVAGSILALVPKLVGMTLAYPILPLILVVPLRILPVELREAYRIRIDDDALRRANIQHWGFWVAVHVALLLFALLGYGWESLMLWYLPGRIATAWLAFIFAWFPHHPELGVGRYVDTRVADFPGSRWLARGHEYHALHHLFPRVPHTRLRRLWLVAGDDLVGKGVPTEGSAPHATGPIRW
jgi:beta-carotene hydroxylase